MKKSYIVLFAIVLIIFSLTCVAYVVMQDRKLHSMTCKNYWTLHEEAQLDLSKKESFMRKHVKLWNSVVQSLRSKYPNLNFYELTEVDLTNDKKGNPSFFMMVMMSCPHTHGSMDDILYANLERNLLKTLRQKKQRKMARAAGCRMYRGVQRKLFDKSGVEGHLEICTSQKYGSGKTSIIKDDLKQPIYLKFCGKGYGHSAPQECIDVFPTKENFCLSDFGVCKKNNLSECGWQHTERSRKCLNDN